MQDLVVVLTAFNLEYEAVRRCLNEVQVVRHSKGTRFEVGTIGGRAGRIALGLTGKGNQPAGILAERAMQQFSPAAVLFVGVAGALWDTPLGDVVVATQVYAYHGGTSEDDGLKARPRAWEAPHGILQLASHLDRSGEWAAALSSQAGVPRAHFAPIAAGELVQNSRVSDHAVWLRQHYNDALAVEMEGAGVAQAGHLNGAPVAIVRGISDRADGSKSTEEDRAWQPRAAANAAAFAVRLAEALISEGEYTQMQQEPLEARGASVVHNYASGPVGIQGGRVSGSTVWMSTAASSVPTVASLAADLAAVRGDVLRERSTGSLDELTYQAAQKELDLAGEALEADMPKDSSRFVLALKRLRGLIADVAEVATKIGALIAAAHGLS